MHTYTALYDTREEAERVQAQLVTLGVIDADGHSLHDRSSAGLTDDPESGREFLAGAVPDEDRRLYKEALRRGGFLLTVNVDDARSDEVRRVLDASNPVDIDEREQQYRQAGYLGLAGTAAAVPEAEAATTRDEQAIPIVEEQLSIGKRSVERGGVRVRAYTVETPVTERVTLREEHVSIERRPVDRRLDAVDSDLLRERTVEVSETAEEAVVSKEARVVEEVVVNKDASQRTETVTDTIRHTEVEVERLPGSTTDKPLNR